MTTVYLIRHGHVDNPEQLFYGPDTPLSERGQRQMIALGQDLALIGAEPTRILCSPYRRTRESAEILAERFPQAVVTQDERLKEWQVGAWEGRPLAEFYAHTRYDQFPKVPFSPDLEPFEQCAARIQAVIREVVELYPHQTILTVSHREPLASAILKYLGKDWNGIHELPLPVGSAWEGSFDGPDTLSHLELRFNHSELE